MRIIKEKKKIEKRLHPFHEDALIKASRRSLFLQPPAEFKNKVIKKYAPKYSRSLLLEPWKDHKLVNALKRIKRIKFVSDDWKGSSGNQWRLILQNKFKFIQEYRQDRDSRESTQKYKLFQNVKKILFTDAEKPSDRLQALKLLKYAPNMKSIKSLGLEINFDPDPIVLTKLNTMTSFLSSLEVLQVLFGTGLILPDFVQCHNILKYTTYLSYEMVAKNEALKILDSLSKQCKNLVYLKTDFSYRSFAGFETQAGECLNVFKNFEKLEEIHIIFEDIFYFLEYFRAPPSLKCLNIDSMRGPWKQAYENFFSEDYEKNSNLKDLLENDERLAGYFEKADGLKNLVSLRFFAYQEVGETSDILTFVKFLLKNLSRLETFELDFNYCVTKAEIEYNEYDDDDDYESPKNESIFIDLGDVFEALRDFCGKLRTLKLSFSNNHTISCSQIPEDFIFPKNTEMKFGEDSINELETIRDLFNMIKRPIDGKKLAKNMKLSMFYTVNDNESLLGLLQILKKSPENYQVEMIIVVKGLDLERFDDVPKLLKEDLVVENVSLEVILIERCHWKALGFLQEMSKNVSFVLIGE